MKKKDYENGVWRTIGGRRVFIRTGQSLSDAMKDSGKFKTRMNEKAVKGAREEDLKEQYKDSLNNVSKMEYNGEITKEEYDKAIKNINRTYIDKRNEYAGIKKEDKFYTRKDGTKEYDPYKGTRFEKKYDSVEDALNDPSHPTRKYIDERFSSESPIEEEARLERERINANLNEEKVNRKLSRQYKTKEKENDRISKGMTKEEYKNGKYNFEYKDGMLTMKDKKGNELNSWGLSKENWEEDKDYWKDKAISEHKEEMYWLTKDLEDEFGENADFNTNYLHKQKGYSYKQIENMSNEEYDRMFKDWKQEKTRKLNSINRVKNNRVVENIGTGNKYYEIGNGQWRSEKDGYDYYIDFNSSNIDNPKYRDVASGRIINTNPRADNYWDYEGNGLKSKYKGTVDYLKQTTNMSGAEILELLKRIDEDKK